MYDACNGVACQEQCQPTWEKCAVSILLIYWSTVFGRMWVVSCVTVVYIDAAVVNYSYGQIHSLYSGSHCNFIRPAKVLYSKTLTGPHETIHWYAFEITLLKVSEQYLHLRQRYNPKNSIVHRPPHLFLRNLNINEVENGCRDIHQLWQTMIFAVKSNNFSII